MKKAFLLLATSLLLGTAAMAQETPPKRDFDFCDVNLISASGLKVNIAVDYGNESKFADIKVKDATNRPMLFNSSIDALHFMTEQGWELVEVYLDPNAKFDNKHYLMRRKRNN